MLLKASTKIEKTQSNAKGDVAPVSPTKHQQWIDTSDEQPILKEWDGTKWIAINFDIEKVDPITIGDIKSDIQSAVDDISSSKEEIQFALNKSQEAIDKADFYNERITTVETKQNETAEKVLTIEKNYNGIRETVESKADKSEVTQLSSQIRTVVEDQNSINKQIQTAEENIRLLQNSQGEVNKRLDTAEGTIQLISKKNEENTEIINQVKNTADSNKITITDTNKKLIEVETNLIGFQSTVTEKLDSIKSSNLFPNNNFSNSDINKEFYGSPSGSLTDDENSKYIVVSKNESDGKDWGEDKCLKMISNTSNYVSLRTDIYYSITPKNPVYLSVDYFNKMGASNIKIRLRFRDANNKDMWVDIEIPKETSKEWKTFTKTIMPPDTATKLQICIGTDISSKNNSLTFVDNIIVSNQIDNETIEHLATKIEQNSRNIDLIASESDSSSYFRVTADKIYAQTKDFVLDSNVTVGDGFKLSADKIESKTLTGKNTSLNLDTGVYTTTNPSTQSKTILADGGIQSKYGTKLVNIGFGSNSYNETGFGIQLKDNNVEQGVLAFDNDSFSVSTDYASGIPATFGIGMNKITMEIGRFGNSVGIQLIKSGSTASLTNTTQNTPTTVTWQDGQGGSISVGGNKSKMSANSSNYMIIGPRYQDTIIEGNKTISVHETFVDINFGNVTRRIKQSNLPDGTTTVFFGTTDGKGGFHFTGGRPYITMGGVTYAFDTKYLTKLTANYNTGE